MFDVCSENVYIKYIFCSCSNRSITTPISISCLRFEYLFPGPAEWKARLQDANKFYQLTQRWVKIPAGFMNPLLAAAANVIRQFVQN